MCRASAVHKTSTWSQHMSHCQLLATLVLSMGALSSGLAKGYTSPALDSILSNYEGESMNSSNTWSQHFFVTQQEASWIASVTMIGSMIAALNGKWIMAWGRQLPLRVTSVPLVAAWMLMSIASSVEMVYIISIIAGACCTVITMVAQTMSGMNPHGATIAIGIAQLIGSLLSGFMIDIVGRLPLLIISTMFMSLALAGFACHAHSMDQTLNLEYPDTAMVSQDDWILLLCVVVSATALAVGISPISWLLTAELFPLEYRDLGLSISTTFSYFCAFVGIKFFMDFQQMLGLHGTFWFYAIVAAFGLCFVVNCVPETKGKQLDEMKPYYAQTR
ncbi:facilitated trehalose transporter Tret1-like [Lasioglossum baleicum]|uniref:facilitated trehalose transporter Tret1-like n=1 Tax=Lasioglossum baleicum TaxID=434251 RepID=UPI003FCDF000